MNTQDTVLVTGASTGIGRATAEFLATKGYAVFGGVRSISKVEPIRGVSLVQLDVDNDASVKSCIAEVTERGKKVDILVNNAGFSVLGAIEETSIEQAKAIFETNFFGTYRTIMAVLPQMRDRKKGIIVNISSVLGFLPAPYMGVYAATKHAIEGLSETLDHELRTLGIRVSLVEPGFTRTKIDSNASHADTPISDYNTQRNRVVGLIGKKISSAGTADSVAQDVLQAIQGKHKMRLAVGGQAKLLSNLRKFAPPAMVDSSIRKEFQLD